MRGDDSVSRPDNAANDKYKLTVNGIQMIKATLAPGMTKVYVWLDYGCMNQDRNPAGELKQLDEIVRHCDLIFTPIFDANSESLSVPRPWVNMYEDYKSPNWYSKDYGHVNRGWCHVEMFYAANIPTKNCPERIERFAAGLRVHASNGIRPHLLY